MTQYEELGYCKSCCPFGHILRNNSKSNILYNNTKKEQKNVRFVLNLTFFLVDILAH